MEGYHKTLLLGILLLAIDQCSTAGVTSEQMMAAGKLMRDVCLPKFPKIPLELVDNLKNGEFPDDKDLKCYVNCILEMMQVMKKGKFNFEASLKQIDLLLPEEHRESYRTGLTACKGAANGIKNHCDASMALLKCLKVNIPTFMFP